MGILDRFRKKVTKERLAELGAKEAAKKAAAQKQAEPTKASDAKPGKAESRSVGKTEKKETRAKDGHAYRVLLHPLMTEKVSFVNAMGQYAFAVSKLATKPQVRRAIQDVYGVLPEKVNIVNYDGKAVRYGRTYGRTKDWKKAYVLLKKGATLPGFEH